ncbi:MAG: hypothetical protein QM756_20445 [Polyangiaceae bacterium]
MPKRATSRRGIEQRAQRAVADRPALHLTHLVVDHRQRLAVADDQHRHALLVLEADLARVLERQHAADALAVAVGLGEIGVAASKCRAARRPPAASADAGRPSGGRCAGERGHGNGKRRHRRRANAMLKVLTIRFMALVSLRPRALNRRVNLT